MRSAGAWCRMNRRSAKARKSTKTLTICSAVNFSAVITAAKSAAEQAGGTVHTGPMEVPGGQFIIIGRDPQGAEFSLVGGQ